MPKCKTCFATIAKGDYCAEHNPFRSAVAAATDGETPGTSGLRPGEAVQLYDYLRNPHEYDAGSISDMTNLVVRCTGFARVDGGTGGHSGYKVMHGGSQAYVVSTKSYFKEKAKELADYIAGHKTSITDANVVVIANTLGSPSPPKKVAANIFVG